ncbi:hypothetical protein [uncultured Methylovirgula sp.]|uniref:hypothetical protein n=1 Tax=uncultured Methylovirgula sp. TaxID=1285960 RepID=UPI00261966EA|nr:hypothetical protein [uncultured Methylovirgula sp.]
MKFLTRSEREERPPEPGGAIKLGVKPQAAAAQAQWGLMLVIFMRVLAGLWICQGLAEWALVLMPERSVLEALPAAMAAAVIFFAIADLVAAVGLWLATPWGGALWLFAASSQIFIALAIKNSISMVWVAIDMVLIALYFFLTFNAGRANAQYAE